MEGREKFDKLNVFKNELQDKEGEMIGESLTSTDANFIQVLNYTCQVKKNCVVGYEGDRQG